MRPFSHEAEAPGPTARTARSADGPSRESSSGGAGESDDAERGSAVVEFTFLSLLLMVPLVYFIITVGQIQGGSFAVVGAADQAAKVYVAQPDAASGRAAAEQAVLLALADYGHPADNASIDTSCEPADCMAAGSAVTVTVHLTVPLPFVPFSDALHLNASQLSASATQMVGRFK
jgi:hypothetical protein